MLPMHLHQQFNVLPTKKEATAPGTMALPEATLRLLRALLTHDAQQNSLAAGTTSKRRIRRPRNSHVLDRRRQGPVGGGSPALGEAEEQQQFLSGPVLRRCPLDVLLGGVRGEPQSPGVCGRGGRGEGLSGVPGQDFDAAPTGDAAAVCQRQPAAGDEQCVCVGAAPGGDELVRGLGSARLSHVALVGSGLENGRTEADTQLSERQGSRLHLLQSLPLVPCFTAR